MKQQISEVFIPFIYFLYTFDRRNNKNMLVIMSDPRFKNMKLVAMFMGHQNATFVVIEYDEKLLMPLLMEANKFLMHDKVETTFDLHLLKRSEKFPSFIT